MICPHCGHAINNGMVNPDPMPTFVNLNNGCNPMPITTFIPNFAGANTVCAPQIGNLNIAGCAEAGILTFTVKG